MLSPGHGNTTSAQKSRKESPLRQIRDWDREHAKPAYLVYRYRGEIRVKRGKAGRVFYPDNNPYTWNTNCPHEFMKVTSYGRILARTEKEVPLAIDILRNYYEDKYDETLHIAETSIRNACECIGVKRCYKSPLRNWSKDMKNVINQNVPICPECKAGMHLRHNMFGRIYICCSCNKIWRDIGVGQVENEVIITDNVLEEK